MRDEFDSVSRVNKKNLERKIRKESIHRELKGISSELKAILASELVDILKTQELLINSYSRDSILDTNGTRIRIRISLVSPDFVPTNSSEEEDTSLSGES